MILYGLFAALNLIATGSSQQGAHQQQFQYKVFSESKLQVWDKSSHLDVRLREMCFLLPHP